MWYVLEQIFTDDDLIGKPVLSAHHQDNQFPYKLFRKDTIVYIHVNGFNINCILLMAFRVFIIQSLRSVKQRYKAPNF